MAQSSIHIESGNLGSIYHNDRSKPTSNSIFNDEPNEIYNTSKQAYQIYREELEKRTLAYNQKTKKNLQKKTITHLSAIVNLNKNHNLNDLNELKNYLEKTLDTKVFQIAIHKDEGHIDTNNHQIKNYHAHIEFMGLDTQGNSVRRKLTKSYLSNLQTFTAQSLSMQRGINYTQEKKRRPKRLDTYEYKRHKELESKELLKKDEIIKQKNKAIDMMIFLTAENAFQLLCIQYPEMYDFIDSIEDEEMRKMAFKYYDKTEAERVAYQKKDKQLLTLVATNEELKAEIKTLREQLKQNGAVRADYAQLEQFSKELQEQIKSKDLTNEDLKNELNKYKNNSHILSQNIDNIEVETKDKELLVSKDEQIKTLLEQLAIKPKEIIKIVEKPVNVEVIKEIIKEVKIPVEVEKIVYKEVEVESKEQANSIKTILLNNQELTEKARKYELLYQTSIQDNQILSSKQKAEIDNSLQMIQKLRENEEKQKKQLEEFEERLKDLNNQVLNLSRTNERLQTNTNIALKKQKELQAIIDSKEEEIRNLVSENLQLSNDELDKAINDLANIYTTTSTNTSNEDNNSTPTNKNSNSNFRW